MKSSPPIADEAPPVAGGRARDAHAGDRGIAGSPYARAALFHRFAVEARVAAVAPPLPRQPPTAGAGATEASGEADAATAQDAVGAGTTVVR